MFGLYLLVGQLLSALAVLTLCAARPAMLRVPEAQGDGDALQDLATLLFAFVVLHAYCAYCQFFIIWNGNLPQEIRWYAPRIRGLWRIVALALIAVHFALPFALLLSRAVKRNPSFLFKVVLLVLAARCVESMWVVLPSYETTTVRALGLITLTGLMMLGMGWLWRQWFHVHLRRRLALQETQPQLGETDR